MPQTPKTQTKPLNTQKKPKVQTVTEPLPQGSWTPIVQAQSLAPKAQTFPLEGP